MHLVRIGRGLPSDLTGPTKQSTLEYASKIFNVNVFKLFIYIDNTFRNVFIKNNAIFVRNICFLAIFCNKIIASRSLSLFDCGENSLILLLSFVYFYVLYLLTNKSSIY